MIIHTVCLALLGCAMGRPLPLDEPRTPTPAEERTPLTPEHIVKLAEAMNEVESFPVPLSTLEAASGVRLDQHLEVSTYMSASLPKLSFSLQGRGYAETDGKPDPQNPLIDGIEIESESELIPPPTPSPSAKAVDIGTYAYIPTIVHTERVGDRYRALTIEHTKRGDDLTLRGWTYTVDDKRGHFISDEEREGIRREVTGMIDAIREDRFAEHYEDFLTRHPEGTYGSHALYGHTMTIRFFDDRNPKYAAEFLKQDGNIAYVGVHVWPEQDSEARFPKPWFFEAMGVDRIDANNFYIGTPYNPVRTDLPAGRQHPLAGLTDPLPDISAAGHRDGGLAYYGHLALRGDGWSAEFPGFYPHDGKTVATDLDPEILQFSSFEVTHSRKR